MVDFTPLFIFRINLYIFLIHLSLDELLFFFILFSGYRQKLLSNFFSSVTSSLFSFVLEKKKKNVTARWCSHNLLCMTTLCYLAYNTQKRSACFSPTDLMILISHATSPEFFGVFALKFVEWKVHRWSIF